MMDGTQETATGVHSIFSGPLVYAIDQLEFQANGLDRNGFASRLNLPVEDVP